MGDENQLGHGFGDFWVGAISWSASGEDLAVRLDDPEGGATLLTFIWATEVDIVMDFGRYSGKALLWEATCEELEGGGRRVWIDFPPVGHIALTCNRIETAAA